MSIFVDRRDAGRRLSKPLMKYKNDAERNTIVLALPRGGVPVGFEVAQALGAPLEAFIVRKIGVPMQPELAMGAIATGGIVVRNEDVIRQLCITKEVFDKVIEKEKIELQRREQAYRGAEGAQPLNLHDRVCIIVDDGIATGASMLAAVLAVRSQNPAKIVVAAPVAAMPVYNKFQSLADEAVCVQTPADFSSVGIWYEYFPQTEEAEVQALLRESRACNSRA